VSESESEERFIVVIIEIIIIIVGAARHAMALVDNSMFMLVERLRPSI
jgi:hypothetical protein